MKNIVILLLILILLYFLPITNILDKLYYATYLTISNIEETGIHYTLVKVIIGIIMCLLSMILIENENWLWLGFLLLINVIIIYIFIIAGLYLH